VLILEEFQSFFDTQSLGLSKSYSDTLSGGLIQKCSKHSRKGKGKIVHVLKYMLRLEDNTTM